MVGYYELHLETNCNDKLAAVMALCVATPSGIEILVKTRRMPSPRSTEVSG